MDGQPTATDVKTPFLPACGPTLAALTLLFTWHSTFTMVITLESSPAMIPYNVARGAFAVVVMAAFGLCRLPRERDWRRLSAPLGAIGCVALPLTAALGKESPLGTGVLSAMAGLVVTWMYLRCFYALSHLEARPALVTLLMSLLCTAAMRVIVFLMPPVWAQVASVPMPALCMALCSRACSLRRDEASPGDPRHAHLGKDYWPAIIEIALFGLVIGIIRMPYEESQYDLTTVVLVSVLYSMVSLALLVWMHVRGARMRIVSFSQMATLIIVTALLVLFFFDDQSSPLVGAVVMAARLGVHAVLLFVLCELVTRSPQHPYVVFGIGWSMFTFSTAAGMLIAQTLSMSRIAGNVAFGLSYLLILGVSLLSSHIREERGYFIEDHAAGINQRFFRDIDDLCAWEGARKGLTPREVEVMQRICKGHNKGRIASDLGLSENTVKAYAKTLYAKLGIHSRQELLALIGIE